MERRGWRHHIEPFDVQYKSQFSFGLGEDGEVLDSPFVHGMSAEWGAIKY